MRAERERGGVGIAREVARGCGDAARLAARFCDTRMYRGKEAVKEWLDARVVLIWSLN